MSYYNATRAMNIGNMDLLNFLDLHDKEGDPDRMYDDMKDQKRIMDSGRETGDNEESVKRTESRIPVAIRRIRSRTDRNVTLPSGDGQMTAHSPRNEGKMLEDWQGAWSASLDKENDANKKLARMHRRKSAPGGHLSLINNNSTAGRISGGGNQHIMCPKCGRSCVMINKDGIYVAFSVGLTPLVLLCVFAVCVLMGWFGLGSSVGPAFFRRLRPAVEKKRSTGGFVKSWLGKNGNP